MMSRKKTRKGVDVRLSVIEGAASFRTSRTIKAGRTLTVTVN